MGPITKKLATMDTRGVDTFIKFAKKIYIEAHRVKASIKCED